MQAELSEEHPERPVWYYRRVGRQYGPVALDYLKYLAADGRLDKRLDFIRHSGSKSWIPSSELDGIHAVVESRGGRDEAEAMQDAWQKQPPIRVVEVCRAVPEQWIGWMFFGVLLTMLSFVPAIMVLLRSEAAYWTMMGLMGGGVVCALVAQGYLTRWVFHGWRVTNQFGSAIPAWLVALLLWVPGVNLVWNFVALWVWAREFNVIISSHPQFRYIRRVRENWILAYCIYPVASPLVHVVLGIGVGLLYNAMPMIAISAYLVINFLNILVYLFLWGRVASDLAHAVDGVHDLNMRQD